jgi:hypothetical protein
MSVKEMVKNIESKIMKTDEEKNNVIEELKVIEVQPIEVITPDVYEVILIKSKNSDCYYITYKKNSKQRLCQYLQSYIKRYHNYMNQKCKKWSGLLKLISLNNLTIEQLQKYDNLDDTITFIEDYIKNNLNNCEDIEKVDIPKIDKITTELVKKPVLTIEEKKERKKQYAKKYYNKNTDKIKTKSVVKAKIYYKKNTEPRKEYQRLRYGEIKKQLKKLHDIEKKL